MYRRTKLDEILDPSGKLALIYFSQKALARVRDILAIGAARGLPIAAANSGLASI
jgi:hypothetical protein